MKSIKYSSVIFLIVIFISSAYSQQKENLGLNINSEMDEIHPTLSPDGKTLYFIRSPKKRDSWGQETWYSTLDANGNWERAKKLSDFDDPEIRNVNVQGFSSDGNTMLLGLDYYDTKDVNNKFLISDRSGLYMSNKGMTGWEEPNRINFDSLKYLTHRNGMILSNDGNSLLLTFSSSTHPDDPHSRILVSFLKTNNSWSKPKEISTFFIGRYYGCFSPFLSFDNRMLFFSGGNSENVDIYVSKRLDDTWLNWTEPKLIGLNILTEGWDADFIISPRSDYAYFVSDDQSIGGTDIFRYKLDTSLLFQVEVDLNSNIEVDFKKENDSIDLNSDYDHELYHFLNTQNEYFKKNKVKFIEINSLGDGRSGYIRKEYYNQDGELTRVEYFNSKGEMWGYLHFQRYKDRFIYKMNGEHPIAEYNEIFREYFITKDWPYSESIFYDKYFFAEGKVFTKFGYGDPSIFLDIYSYNHFGKLHKVLSYLVENIRDDSVELDNELPKLLSISEYKYNSDKLLIEVEMKNGIGELVSSIKLKYNERGLVEENEKGEILKYEYY